MLGGMLGTVTGSFAGGVASSDPAHGVVRTGDFAVTQNGTPNMSVNVAAGGAFIRGTQNANQGAYHVWNDGTVNLSISAADVTNGRRDLVIAQVRDAFYSGATNDARITVVTGTPAASPADPSLASFPNALVLARITVAAGDTAINTADITDLRTVANQIGKIPTYNTSALATVANPSPVDGQAYYLNLGTTGEGPYWFNGSSYTRPWNMAWGAVAATSGGTGGMAYRTGLTWDANTGNTDVAVTNGSITISAVANRLYRATFNMGTLSTDGSGSAGILIDNGSGSTKVRAENWIEIGKAQNGSVSIVETFASSGSQTFRAMYRRGSGFVNRYLGDFGMIVVEDIGPSGAPV